MKGREYNHLAIEKKWQKEWSKKKVFETKNLQDGWDGTFNGKQLNAAIFAWTLTGIQNEKPIAIKGMISLIK